MAVSPQNRLLYNYSTQKSALARRRPKRKNPRRLLSDGGFGWLQQHFVYLRWLSNGDVGIVTILHERMHQIDRFREDFSV
ncbi:hypothetical protein [Azonexus fungiphilus]|uniref:hypothetical protein n=1 Tax=Azonexus fungiphilus TaxID=146940 RepID=UPI0020C1FD5D|nr:hypothetical protein [Azonexus fungiphilus]